MTRREWWQQALLLAVMQKPSALERLVPVRNVSCGSGHFICLQSGLRVRVCAQCLRVGDPCQHTLGLPAVMQRSDLDLDAFTYNCHQCR
jgi:hypothetical protein